jgi:multiple sugar transport system substrate-binding protein
VVWWEKGAYPEEDAALREIIAAFEQESGKQVELVLQQQEELPQKIMAALDAARPPDFAFGILLQNYVAQWAVDDRLADLSEPIGAFSNLFDPDTLAWVTWHDAKSGAASALWATGRP